MQSKREGNGHSHLLGTFYATGTVGRTGDALELGIWYLTNIIKWKLLAKANSEHFSLRCCFVTYKSAKCDLFLRC